MLLEESHGNTFTVRKYLCISTKALLASAVIYCIGLQRTLIYCYEAMQVTLYKVGQSYQISVRTWGLLYTSIRSRRRSVISHNTGAFVYDGQSTRGIQYG
ncbi:hypothetical protein HBH69_218920 [Parastagonospora nodorum]|nr:hypothetical protein HBH61_223930 [Parastagonospora nodorum]KAH5008410.1 hypothetical protein HBI75_215730 [Parastagonospora nodorum]KAH5139240.1 hypothetical protein HBH69_218920 [Parastagonospora nodorum]KAH5758486.1 hypothetical protein HBI16_200170 [Parastagonospora nodorum]KAH6028520.1 hypothetical protein HBI54_231950 [Parastagonospora nodorum]